MVQIASGAHQPSKNKMLAIAALIWIKPQPLRVKLRTLLQSMKTSALAVCWRIVLRARKVLTVKISDPRS
jgi:hypothetical protein